MQQGPEPIVIVTTGGTIDKAYFDALSTYQIGEPVVKKLLDGANVTHPYRIVELLRKDSLELTDEDRAAAEGDRRGARRAARRDHARHRYDDRLRPACWPRSRARPSC